MAGRRARAVGDIPEVTTGDVIQEAWGDQVAQAINNHVHEGVAGMAGEDAVSHTNLVNVGPNDHHAHDPASNTAAIEFIIDGAGAVITTGVKADLLIPFPCTVTQWTLLADAVGSITINVWRDTYAGYPPEAAGLLGSPAIANANKAQSGVLAVQLAAGDILRLNVASAATIKRVTLALTAVRP